MRTTAVLLAATLGLAGLAGQAAGQTQTVTFEVQAINQISVAGTPSLTINAATAGSAPTSATYGSGSWSITTNESNKSVQAKLDSDMPAGVSLSLNMTAPTSSGTSAGAQALTSNNATLVTGITKLNQASIGMTYTLAATAAAGTVGSTSRTVTFTIF